MQVVEHVLACPAAAVVELAGGEEAEQRGLAGARVAQHGYPDVQQL